jgi:transposase
VQKEAIILARFGEYAHNREPLNSIASISRCFRVPITTIVRTIKQFEVTGQLKIKKRGVKGVPISAQNIGRLLDPQNIRNWAPYSLRDRQVLFERKYNTPISLHFLREAYRANGVKYKNTEWQYRTAQRNIVELTEKRQRFSIVLARIIE